MGVQTIETAPKPPSRSWWRVLLIVVVSIISVPASAVSVLFAFVFYSGCFVGCPDGGPQRHIGAGVGFGALSAVLFFAGPLLAWRLTHSKRWVAAAFLLPLALVIWVLILGAANH